MKKNLLFLLLIPAFQFGFSQTSSISWGSEFHTKRQTAGITLIGADNTGTYFEEKIYPFTIGIIPGAKIRKYDHEFKEIYTEDLSKDLKGMVFNRFLKLKDKIFIIALTKEKKESQYTVYGAEINRSNGALNSGWKALTSVYKDFKFVSYDFTFISSADSSSIILVANAGKTDEAEYKIVVLDEQLTTKSSTSIRPGFAKRNYELIDVLFTNDNKLYITGKIYEIARQYNKENLTFKKLLIEKYNITGNKEFDIKTNESNHLLLSAKVVMNKNRELFVCGYYSKDAKTTGIIVNRINQADGSITFSSVKEISPKLTSKFINDPEDKEHLNVTDYNKEATEKTYGFLGHCRFKEVYLNPDNSILLIAEKFKADFYERTYSGNGTSSFYTVNRFTSGDILVTIIQSDGNIKNLHVIPKMQIEETTLQDSAPTSTDFFYSLTNSSEFPKYSSFTTFRYQNSFLFYYNDQSQNILVTKPEQTTTAVSNLYKSICYELKLDLGSGNITRKILFNNQKQPTALIRNSKETKTDLFFLSYKEASLGKLTYKIGKITIR